MKLIKSICIIFLINIFFHFSLSAQNENGFELIKNMEITDLINQHLEKYFVDEPQFGHLSKVGIDAMLKELDPYTVYYHEANMEDYRLMTTGQYGGIGAVIRQIDGYVHIAEPYEGSPALNAGLKAGDKILSIDDKDMYNLPTNEVSGSLKGPKGSSITIELDRPGEGIKKINVTRDEIQIPDVPYSGMLDKSIGYIKLNSFTQTASVNVKKSFTALKSEGMKQLVLDLRGNGGGLLMEAVRIVNLFIPKGQIVVNTKGRVIAENRTYTTSEEPIDLNIPLVVLIDEGSASASEIVSGSLQDLDRAVIIGQTSFGKGLVQRTYDLKYGSKMKLTIAKYYTPSGRCVQRLEYYDHEEGEQPQEIADSLLKKFQTKNGRTVIDGRGIEPDIKINNKKYSRLTTMLYRGNLIFNYATEYYLKNKTADSPEDFKFTDKDFDEFKNYVLKEDFTYTTTSEEMLEKVKEVAEKEGYFEHSSEEYEALLAKLTPSIERDLEQFKNEIIPFLENEIISRYYFQKGRAVQSFKNVLELKEATRILSNSKEYNNILSKEL